MTAHRLAVVAAVLGLASPAWAQPPDEPGRGVARISLMNGDVSVRRGDSGDYVAAALNAPLVVQDRVLTGVSSRAEVQFDWANFLRLSHNAEVRLAELEWRRYLVQLARGSVTWRVLRDSDANVEISTPSVSVRPVRRGTYRIAVLDDGSSEVTVRSGEAEIFTPRGSERLRSGRTMFVRGSVSDPEFRVGQEIPDDEWDRWNIARDRDLERSRSYQYVSRDIYGAEDLDHHGRWVHVASYGWVWTPHVAVGWAPYRHGRWAWMDWYGWSWVSYDPWGWAPYHYGRWFYHGPVGWCWWPGSIGVRHYWSPGLVAFVGFGRVGVGFGWGRVGWIPLAPFEPFHPWYGRRWYGGYRNRTYIDNSVTVVNNVNVTNIYRNSRIDNAVTVVDNDNFRRGRFGDTVRVNIDEVRTASLARGPLPIAPERDHLRLADRDATVRGVERSGGERFFSNRRPAEVDRVSFDDQRRGIEQLARRSFGEDTGRVATAETGRSAGDGGRATRSAEQRGWRRADEAGDAASSGRGVSGDDSRRFSSGRTAEAAQTPDAGGRTASDGWTRFGSGRAASDDAARAASGRSADAAARGAESTGRSAGGDESRRFGSGRAAPDDANRTDTGRSAEPAARGAESTGRSAGGDEWRRFGSGRAAPNDANRTDTGRSAEPAARGAESTGRSAGSDEWRRFGGNRAEASDPSRAVPSSGDSGRSAGSDRGVSSDGGRRFGSPRVDGDAPGRSAGSERPAETDGRSVDPGRGVSSDGWRRFGSPRVDGDAPGRSAGGERPAETDGRSVDPGRGVSSDGWRRFGSPRIDGSETGRSFDASRGFGDRSGTDAPAAPSGSGRSSSVDNWRRFDGGGSSRPQSSVSDFGAGRSAGSERGIERDSRRGAEPSGRSYEPPARSERRDWGGGDSIRISPPIVRERGGFGGGGGRSSEGPRSAPSGGDRGSFGGGGMRGADGGGGRSAPSASPGGGGGGRGGDGGGGGRSAGGGRGR